MAETMQALRLTAPHRHEIALRPVPAPAPGEALVRVAAVGLCGTDVELAHGTAPYLVSGRARLPLTPGHEWSGHVAALGAGVAGLAVGQLVVGECSVGCGACGRCAAGAYHLCPDLTETGILNRDGAFAEFLTLPARALHPVPAGVSPEAAALCEPAAVALNGVRRAGATAGAPLTIFGDGPIGLLALLVARALGVGPVTVVGATSHRMALAERLGARVLGDDAVPPPAPHVLEATGNPRAVAAALAAVAPGGTLALLGLFGGRSAALDLDRLVTGDITLTGVLGSPGLWPQVLALLASGRLDPLALVSHRLPLSDFGQALTLAESRRSVKILLHPRGA